MKPVCPLCGLEIRVRSESLCGCDIKTQAEIDADNERMLADPRAYDREIRRRAKALNSQEAMGL